MHADELLKLAKKEKLTQLESAWTESLAPEECGRAGHFDVLQVLVERGHRELAETLLWYLADTLREDGQTERALEAARGGALLLPRSDAVRGLLADLYATSLSGREDVESLLALTVCSADMPLDEALDVLDKFLTLRPGDYLLDPQRGQVGRVEGLDAEGGGLIIRFAEFRKTYGPSFLGRLEPVGEDDFRALCAFEQERLAELAEQDPEELVRIVLSAVDRRMELRRLRLYLEPVVGTWSKWWRGARKKLNRSSSIGMTEGRSPSLFLRSRPMSHAERVLHSFGRAREPMRVLSAALKILREAQLHGELSAEDLQPVADRVGRMAAELGDDAPALVLAAAAVRAEFTHYVADQDVAVDVPDGALKAMLASPESLPAAIANDEVMACTMEFVRRHVPQAWRDFFAALMPSMGVARCALAARHLHRDGADDLLVEACQEILVREDRNPGALAWLWREMAGGQADGGLSAIDPAAVALQVLTDLAMLVRASGLSDRRRKDQIALVRNALFMRDGAVLHAVLEQARPEQFAAIRGLGERNPGLTDNMLASLRAMLEGIRPSLFHKEVPPWEEAVLYTTEAGLERRRADLEHIVHVRLPEVIREVGQAAAFGDLSDNAEYTAAVQERARLAERAARMQEEMAEARPITPQMVAVDHVTVGSRVRARNAATGREEAFTFLGPWDARPEEGVYAYNAPLGLAFMGKGVGDVASFGAKTDERRWKILEVLPGL